MDGNGMTRAKYRALKNLTTDNAQLVEDYVEKMHKAFKEPFYKVLGQSLSSVDVQYPYKVQCGFKTMSLILSESYLGDLLEKAKLKRRKDMEDQGFTLIKAERLVSVRTDMEFFHASVRKAFFEEEQSYTTYLKMCGQLHIGVSTNKDSLIIVS